MKYSIFFTIVIITFSFAGNVLADFFKYEDERGTIHLTNDRSNVPERYRQRLVVIEEKKEFIKEQVVQGKYILDGMAEKMLEMKLEAEKLWWSYIIDPSNGKTKAPAIVGGYIFISLMIILMIRSHVHGRARKILMKFLFLGLGAVVVLVYAAHRGHKVYEKYKNSDIEKFLSLPEVNIDKL